MIDIKEIENEIIGKETDNNNHSLAYLLIMELKASARRWFIIAMTELFIILAIIAAMLWYNSLPIDEYAATITSDGTANSVVGVGDNYGDTSVSESNTSPR